MITQLLDYANVVESCAVPSFMLGDCDRLNDTLRFRPREVDGQQSILQIGSQYLHSISQYEAALELARRNAAMEIFAGLLVVLAAADHQLAFLDGDIEFVAGKP